MGVAKGRSPAHNDVCVHLAVLRLPAVSSDLLVSVTAATRVDAASAAAARAGVGERGGGVVEESRQLLLDVLGSLEVRDWGLFGG
jgi:hypothetical protein